MNVSKISLNTNIKSQKQSASNSKNQKNNSVPAFKGASLGLLTREEIKKLYFDGPALLRVVEETLPALKKKFNGFFDAILNIKPDVERTIYIDVVKNFNREEALNKYIVENNHKLHLPEKIVTDIKSGSPRGLNLFLNEQDYTPVLFSFDKLGVDKSIKTIQDFTKDITTEKIITDMYKMNQPRVAAVERKRIPSYYWEFPGG